jgi:hypothetical protein
VSGLRCRVSCAPGACRGYVVMCWRGGRVAVLARAVMICGRLAAGGGVRVRERETNRTGV